MTQRITQREAIKQLKDLIRHPFAWPGGYPKFGVFTDGGAVCHVCAKDNFRSILRATKQQLRDGWQFESQRINWEEPHLICGQCGHRIESAYAED